MEQIQARKESLNWKILWPKKEAEQGSTDYQAIVFTSDTAVLYVQFKWNQKD